MWWNIWTANDDGESLWLHLNGDTPEALKSACSDAGTIMQMKKNYCMCGNYKISLSAETIFTDTLPGDKPFLSSLFVAWLSQGIDSKPICISIWTKKSAIKAEVRLTGFTQEKTSVFNWILSFLAI